MLRKAVVLFEICGNTVERVYVCDETRAQEDLALAMAATEGSGNRAYELREVALYDGREE